MAGRRASTKAGEGLSRARRAAESPNPDSACQTVPLCSANGVCLAKTRTRSALPVVRAGEGAWW